MRVCEIVDKTPRVHSITLPPLSPPCDDAFHYLKAAVRKEITPLPEDLPSLENNLIVAKILDAAKE
jgi:hypothetical protein